MSLKPRVTANYKARPTAFRDFKMVEFTVGNVIIDASKFNDGDVLPAFTAIHRNPTSNLYEKVEEATADTMVGAVVTTEDVVIEDKTVNEQAPAVRKAALIEERCHGVTANFKKAVQGRITFDV